MKTPKTFPKKIAKGNVTLKIYKSSKTKKGVEYVEFKLVYRDAEGKRIFESFSEYAKAKQAADNVSASFSKGDVKALSLTSQDRLVYLRAVESLKPYGLPLDIATAQFADAQKRLGGLSLSDAVDFYVRRHPGKVSTKTVKEIVADLISAKRADGSSEVYLKDLAFRLGKFGDSFGCALSIVTAVEINAFLRSLGKSGGRSRNNYRAAISTLFGFAESNGYLPRGYVDFEDVARAREGQFEIEIFTPAEMAALLKAAQLKPEDLRPGYNNRYAMGQGLLPLFVLGGFAGLRTAEVCRQKWSDINLERGFLRVTAVKGNTAQKRQVPISNNLRQWLALCKRDGDVCCGYPRPEDAIARIAKRAGVKWKHNALRHSFVSYRVEETQDVAKVSNEAGNSPKMIHKHYRNLVTPADATAWFSILPG